MSQNVLPLFSTSQKCPQWLQLDVGEVDIATKLLEEGEDFFIEGGCLFDSNDIVPVC